MTVIVFSKAGVLLSTVLIWWGFHLLSGLMDHPVPYSWFLVFGALISLTDPAAVVDILKRTDVTLILEATIAG